MKNKIQSILIAFILLMYGFLYAVADYENAYKPSDRDSSIFYITEAIVFCLVALYGIFSNIDKNFKYAWIILAAFFLIRLTWEIKAAIYGMSINEKEAAKNLFIADAIAAFLVTYMPILRNLYKKIVKWQRLK